MCGFVAPPALGLGKFLSGKWASPQLSGPAWEAVRSADDASPGEQRGTDLIWELK